MEDGPPRFSSANTSSRLMPCQPQPIGWLYREREAPPHRGSEARIGREAQTIAGPASQGLPYLRDDIERNPADGTSWGKQAIDAICILLLLLAMILLDLRVAGQGVQPIQFGLIEPGPQRQLIASDCCGARRAALINSFLSVL